MVKMNLYESAKEQKIGSAQIKDSEQLDFNDAIARNRQRKLQYPLCDDELSSYKKNGFIHLKNVFSKDEVQQLLQASDEVQNNSDIIQPNNIRFECFTDSETNETKVWKADPISDLSPVFGALVRSRKILDPLASIYNGNEPFLFKEKLIFKPPGGRGSALHQDYNWWQGFPESLISVMIALDPADLTNGCTHLVPGYEDGFLTKPGEFGDLEERQVRMSEAVPIMTEPGDVAIFHCYAPHFAGANNSPNIRRQIFLTYNDSADGDHYQSQRLHYEWYVTRYRDEDSKQKVFYL